MSAEITGRIDCQCQLSGIPDLTLTFCDPSLLDDCSLHPCVRLRKFESERVISFVPPDGDFTLCEYKVSGDKLLQVSD